MVVGFATTCAIRVYHVVSSNSAQARCIQYKFVSDLRMLVFSGHSATNKTDRHDITEILLKVALNTTTLSVKGKVKSQQFRDLQ